MLNVDITSGKINNKAQKVVIYGPEGIGKSTFAAHFPNPLFIDTEGSTGEHTPLMCYCCFVIFIIL